MSDESTPDAASYLNDNRDGWCRAMGLTFVRATADEVTAEWTVGPEHLQAYGIVHGGVYSGVIETLASVGAALFAVTLGKNAVGLENHTSFLRAARAGRMRARATPVVRGRTSQVWECEVVGEDGRPVATGRVRMLCVDAQVPLAGAMVTTGPRSTT